MSKAQTVENVSTEHKHHLSNSAAGLTHLSLSYMQNVVKLSLNHRDLCCQMKFGLAEDDTEPVILYLGYHTLNYKTPSPPLKLPFTLLLRVKQNKDIKIT